MLSGWIRSSVVSRLSHFITSNHQCFSTYRDSPKQQGTYNNTRQRKDFFNNTRKLFNIQNNNKRTDRNAKTNNQNDINVEEYVKTINEINREFLGIKVNTDYFKVYNEKSFENVCKPDKTQFFKINDIPFTVRPKTQAAHNQENNSQFKLPNTTAVKMVRHMIPEERLKTELQKLAKSYFTDLVSKQRNSRIEANFQAEARKVLETVKTNRWIFKVSNTDQTPNVTIKNITILKGVKVNRNDNYTVDSYKVDSEQEEQGIFTYTLFKKQREQYPEAEWFAQKFIVARIQADVTNCPIVEISEENSVISWNKGLSHSFVFEADLTVPPSLSLLSLSPEEQQFLGQFSLKSYRLKPENIYITNVDKKNIWFNMAYKEEEKKNKLINKII